MSGSRGDRLDLKQGVKEWRELLSGGPGYCSGRTGWTGIHQMKLFNPQFQPGPDQNNSSGDFHLYVLHVTATAFKHLNCWLNCGAVFG